VLDGVGEGDMDAVRQNVHRGLQPFDILVEAVRDDQEVTDALVNDALLQMYLIRFGINSLPPPAASASGYSLDPAVTARVLNRVNEIALSPAEIDEKNAELEPFLRAVVEIATERDT
jgi:hypothetical protein